MVSPTLNTGSCSNNVLDVEYVLENWFLDTRGWCGSFLFFHHLEVKVQQIGSAARSLVACYVLYAVSLVVCVDLSPVPVVCNSVA